MVPLLSVVFFFNSLHVLLVTAKNFVVASMSVSNYKIFYWGWREGNKCTGYIFVHDAVYYLHFIANFGYIKT